MKVLLSLGQDQDVISAATSQALLVNPLAQMGDRRREGDDEGTSETREQHAGSCYRD